MPTCRQLELSLTRNFFTIRRTLSLCFSVYRCFNVCTGYVILIPRDHQPNAVDESVMVHTLQYNFQTNFLLKPVTYVAVQATIWVIVSYNCWGTFLATCPSRFSSYIRFVYLTGRLSLHYVVTYLLTRLIFFGWIKILNLLYAHVSCLKPSRLVNDWPLPPLFSSIKKSDGSIVILAVRSRLFQICNSMVSLTSRQICVRHLMFNTSSFNPSLRPRGLICGALTITRDSARSTIESSICTIHVWSG